MALAYLLDPSNQYQNQDGVNNVSGWFEVFRTDTDDRATVYSDFSGTLAPEHIGIDNNGRAVMIVDSGKSYRVEMRAPNGGLLWTQQPVWTMATGGGVPAVRVESSDGSIAVDRSTVGSVTTYDLSLAEDSTDLLNWIRCEGAQKLDGTDTWRPVYAAGTMLVGEKGIALSADQYYHVTAHIRATKSSAAPYYDDIFLLYKLDDGTTVTPVTRQTVIVDCSLGLSQDFEFSTDVMAESDCELLLDILGREQAGISFEVLNVELHRVYSGAPHIPGGTIRAEQSDWTEADDSKMSFIKHKPDLSLYVTDSELETILEGYATTTALSTGLASKQDTISDLSDIRAGASLGSTAVQPGDLATVATTGSYNDLLDRPTIPTVPVQDVEVNGSSVVNAQGVAEITIDTGAFVAVYGTTTMAQVTAAYDSGKDIVCRYNDGRGRVYSGQLSSFSYGVYTFSTTDGFTEYDFTLSPNGGDGAWAISSKSIPSVDSSYNASSYAAQSGVAVAQALSSYTPTASLSTVATTGDYDDLLNKPAIPVLPDTKDLVAGSNISITETSSTVTIAATAAPQLQANWNETDTSSVQYIQNKPTIPVLPSTKDLVAGNNITITEGTDDVTVACDITVGTVTL
jgi:hypothetical protein